MQFIDTLVNFFEHVSLAQCRLEVAPELWCHLAVKLLLRHAEEPFNDNVHQVVFLQHTDCTAKIIFWRQLLEEIIVL